MCVCTQFTKVLWSLGREMMFKFAVALLMEWVSTSRQAQTSVSSESFTHNTAHYLNNHTPQMRTSPLISTLVYTRPRLHEEVYKTTSEMRKTPPLIRTLNLSCSNSVWNRWIPLYYTNIQLNTRLHLLWVCCVCVHSLQLFWHVRSTDCVCCSPGKNVQGRLHKIP